MHCVVTFYVRTSLIGQMVCLTLFFHQQVVSYRKDNINNFRPTCQCHICSAKISYTVFPSLCSLVPPSRRLATSPRFAPLSQSVPARPAGAHRSGGRLRRTRAADGRRGSPPEPLLDAVRARQQQRGLLQRARPEVAQGLGAPCRRRRRRVRGRGVTG